jgi:ABC-type proline/glycine betaine transport system ATPase subunit
MRKSHKKTNRFNLTIENAETNEMILQEFTGKTEALKMIQKTIKKGIIITIRKNN